VPLASGMLTGKLSVTSNFAADDHRNFNRHGEAFDRGEKFRRYRTWLPTLQDYLLVAQDKPLIDHYHRVEENRWELVPREGLEASLHLESVHCTLRLADVYDRIIFPPEDAELAQDQPAGS
jgi:hypothetical protein